MNIYLILGLGVLLVAMTFLLLKYRKDVSIILKKIWSKIKTLKPQVFTIPFALVIMVLVYLIAPDKYYYFIFVFLFCIGLYKLVSHLMDYVYIVSLDWGNDNLEIYQLSNRALNNYKIIDEDNKPSFARFWIKCKSGKIIFVDNIDSKQKIMVINPIHSNFEFVKNYKEIDVLLKKTINKLSNDLAKLEGEMEYKTIMKAKEILENNSLLSTIADANNNAVKEVKDIKQPTGNESGGESSGK